MLAIATIKLLSRIAPTPNGVSMKKNNAKIPRTVFFTEKEQKVIDSVVEYGSYERASKGLEKEGVKISVNAMRGVTLQIRLRYGNAKKFVESCEKYQAALSRKDRKKLYITGAW